jgi:hypothetical protein
VAGPLTHHSSIAGTTARPGDGQPTLAVPALPDGLAGMRLNLGPSPAGS